MVDILADTDVFAAPEADYHGERLFIPERVVVSPVTGVFAPVAGMAPLPPWKPSPRRSGRSDRSAVRTDNRGTKIDVGDVVGVVGSTEVRSPFAGRMVGLLARPGDRVMAGQPLAWLRVTPHKRSTG